MSRAKKKNINNPAERRAGWVFGCGKVAQMGEIEGGKTALFFNSFILRHNTMIAAEIQ